MDCLVFEIVKNVFEVMLVLNGYVLFGDGECIYLEVVVKNFWFDYKVGFVIVEFYGNM